MKKFIWLVILIYLLGSSCASANGIGTKKINNSSVKTYTVSQILQDGKGDFDPWNTIRWSAWYNEKGELIHPFLIDTSVHFKKRSDAWEIKYSNEFNYKAFFIVEKQGVTIKGNNIVFDVRTNKQKLPLNELYKLKKEPWNEGCEIIGILYHLPQIKEIQPTVIRGFIFMGLKRGIKINGTGNKEEHRLIIENCTFSRNRIGFYTNGYNTMIKKCKFYENGYGAVYSGSKSRRNQFLKNSFRDNTLSQHQYSYADFIGDTFFNSEIRDNNFLKSQLDGKMRRIGISIFRNMGESNNLREQMPHNNIISGNYFNGYSVAINIGGRMGRKTRNDITGEGRDYAFYNRIDSNKIENSVIGIKINTEGNSVSNNKFENVDEKIVLHCVFFELENTTINYQKNDEVKFWYTKNDYLQYANWFGFQDDLNEYIQKNEKRIEVFSEQEGPLFPENSGSLLVLNPPIKDVNYQFNNFRVGPPIQLVNGEFSLDLDGEETVAIWEKPVSRVNATNYYSILIFDKHGTEINRCGLSKIKWKQIAAGYFTKHDGEMEIAAIPAEPLNGKYPVYIFDRGFRIPKEIRYSENTDPGITISIDNKYNLVVSFKK